MSWQATYAHRHRRVQIEQPPPPPPAYGSPEWQRNFNATMTAAMEGLAQTRANLRKLHQEHQERLTRRDVGPVR